MVAQPQTCDNRHFNILQTLLSLKLLLVCSRYKQSFLLVHLLLGSIYEQSLQGPHSMKREKYWVTRVFISLSCRQSDRIEWFSQRGFYTEILDIRYWINTVERKGYLSKLSPLKPATRLELHKCDIPCSRAHRIQRSIWQTAQSQKVISSYSFVHSFSYLD